MGFQIELGNFLVESATQSTFITNQEICAVACLNPVVPKGATLTMDKKVSVPLRPFQVVEVPFNNRLDLDIPVTFSVTGGSSSSGTNPTFKFWLFQPGDAIIPIPKTNEAEIMTLTLIGVTSVDFTNFNTPLLYMKLNLVTGDMRAGRIVDSQGANTFQGQIPWGLYDDSQQPNDESKIVLSDANDFTFVSDFTGGTHSFLLKLIPKQFSNSLPTKFPARYLFTDKSVTANENEQIIDTRQFQSARFYLNVTAITGTDPTLDIDIETIQLSGENFAVANFPTIVDSTGKWFLDVDLSNVDNVRPALTVGGTSPDYTLELGATFE